MAYTIAGTYVLDCACSQICPCAIDGQPTGPEDQCWGGGVFHIDRGDQDGVDLAGVNFGLVNHFPANLTSGNWTVGIVVDEGASDDQVKAIEKIVSGQAGGPFGEFAPLIGEYTGMKRGSIEMSDKGASIGGVGEFAYEQLAGPDGGPTVSRNAMFGFAPEYRLGRASGSFKGIDMDVQASYGESADFEYSSEETGAVHPRA